MKEIKVTDSFLGLDSDARKCQNIETYNECKSKHLKTIEQECGCLPLPLRLSEEVKVILPNSK